VVGQPGIGSLNLRIGTPAAQRDSNGFDLRSQSGNLRLLHLDLSLFRFDLLLLFSE
jgi:hypothetical protein